MLFFDVHDQSRYSIEISRPENVEELSDCFISKEELEELTGRHIHIYANGKPQRFLLRANIEAEVKKWCDKLDASGKKTLPIDDEDLLKILTSRNNYLSDFTKGNDYCRHGDRISYARRYERVKKRPTKSDVRDFWIRIFPYAFRHKYGCYPPAISTYDRHWTMFKAYKKITGWKACRMFMSNPDQVKFYRKIWDNPEEYV